jgi:3-hydroxybutyryl-CoA dehydrogenase
MDIDSIGIVGAGTMGSGIAQACAVKGLPVVMIDINQQAIDRGRAAIGASLDRLIKKQTLSGPEKSAALERITTGLDLSALAGAPLVIEAATENEAVKIGILKQLDTLLPASAIIATNTSSISITRLGAATHRPDRVIGVHFFNPVPLMALVELIRGLVTSEATYEAVKAFTERLGKTPITVKNAPGFVVNRILVPMINEAFYVLAEGIASPADIDAGMKLGCNHPIGPLALGDMIGLDVCLAVLEVYYAEFEDSKYRVCPLLKEMVAAGWLGRKTGRGVYHYPASQ